MKLSALVISALIISGPLGATEPARRSVSPQVVGAVSHLLIPTSAFVNGAFNSLFKTRVAIKNVTNAQYSIRAGFSKQSGEVAARSITIFPLETLTYENFIDQVFQSSGGGAIDLDSGNANFRFIASVQVYVDGPNGRFTTAVQSADEAGTIISGRPGYVVGISVTQFDRTNFGCASDSAFPQVINASVSNATGNTVGSLSFSLAPFGWNQVPVNIGVDSGTLFITTNQRAVCYGVTVDNTSNDGTFVLAVPN